MTVVDWPPPDDGLRERWMRDRIAATRYGLQRAAGIARGALVFRHCECGERVFAEGRVRVVANGTIRIGSRTRFNGGKLVTELVCQPGAELIIGAEGIFDYGVSIRAARSVRIGARCVVGSMVRVYDSDREGDARVVIGDAVSLSHGVVVAPGVTIGDGAVVAAGSVVTQDVPARSLASGNPATFAPLTLVAGLPAAKYAR